MNIYILTSSLPLLYAVELQKKYQENSICFICNSIVGSYSKSELELAHNTFFKVFIISDMFGLYNILKHYLFITSKLHKINIENLYVGNIGVNLLALMYNRLKANKKYIIEDGTSTIPFSEFGHNYYNNEKSFYIKNFLKHLFFLEKKVHKLISIYDISNSILETEVISLSFLLNKDVILNNDLLILGGPQLNLNQMDAQTIEESIERLIALHKKKYKINKVIYRPHPRENMFDVQKLIERFNMILFQNNSKHTVFELYYANAKEFPIYVCSLFPSSALLSLCKIDKRLQLTSYDFNKNEIYPNHQDESMIISKKLKELNLINFYRYNK